MSSLFRRDVEQADIASLMAALIGINWPVNSVGVLPDVDPSLPGYLDSTYGAEGPARAALVNAKVILEQYRLKHGMTSDFRARVSNLASHIVALKQKHSLFYTPYKPLAHVITTENTSHILAIDKLITEERWDDSQLLSSRLIQESLKGLHYIQTYDRFLIRGFVTAAYLGWAAYASLYIFRPLDAQLSVQGIKSSVEVIVTIGSWFIMTGFWALFALQKSPWSFYVYIAFPCFFWQQFLVQVSTFLQSNPSKLSAGEFIGYMTRCAMVVAALLGMVVCTCSL